MRELHVKYDLVMTWDVDHQWPYQCWIMCIFYIYCPPCAAPLSHILSEEHQGELRVAWDLCNWWGLFVIAGYLRHCGICSLLGLFKARGICRTVLLWRCQGSLQLDSCKRLWYCGGDCVTVQTGIQKHSIKKRPIWFTCGLLEVSRIARRCK